MGMGKEDIDSWYKRQKDVLNEEHMKDVLKKVPEERLRENYKKKILKLQKKYLLKLEHYEKQEEKHARKEEAKRRRSERFAALKTTIYPCIAWYANITNKLFNLRFHFLFFPLLIWKYPPISWLLKLFKRKAEKQKDVSKLTLEIRRRTNQQVYAYVRKEILALSPSMKLREGIKMMIEKSHNCLFVMDKATPMGELNEMNIMKMTSGKSADILDQPVSKILDPELTFITSLASIGDVYELLEKKKKRRALVMDNALKGLMSIQDLFDIYFELLHNVEMEGKAPRTVKDFMTSPYTVCKKGTLALKAVDQMIVEKSDYIIIMDGERAEGIFTTNDYMKFFLKDPERLKRFSIEHVMVSPICEISPHVSVIEALNQFERKKFRRMIVRIDHHPFGILTQEDIIREILNNT